MLIKGYELIKRAILLELVNKNNAIIIAGLGRCGTTLLYDSIIRNHYYNFSNDIINMSRFTEGYKDGFIYKSHDYPPKSLPTNVKIVFMFGNPYNTVISTHRRINEWGIMHHRHLNSKLFETNDNIFYKDTLGLELLFDSWYKSQNFEFLSLRYESLYNKNTIRILGEYLGMNLKLFPKKARKAEWEQHHLKDKLIMTYGGLFKKIYSSEDVKVWK